MKQRLCALALLSLLAGCPEQGADQPSSSAATPATPASAAMPAANDANAELGRYHWRLQDATDAKESASTRCSCARTSRCNWISPMAASRSPMPCNRMGGGYTLDGESLTVASLASTMMACADPKLMALDGEIGKRLQRRVETFAAGRRHADAHPRDHGRRQARVAGEPTAQTRYGGPGERMFLEVAAHTHPCPHPLIPNKQCLQVREVKYDGQGLRLASGAFENFYEGIEGYTHEDGVRNVLRVNRYTIETRRRWFALRLRARHGGRIPVRAGTRPDWARGADAARRARTPRRSACCWRFRRR